MDVGKIAEENGYGIWCKSEKPEGFTAMVDKIHVSDRRVISWTDWDVDHVNESVDGFESALDYDYEGAETLWYIAGGECYHGGVY